MPVSAFEKQMAWLARAGFQGVTLSEALAQSGRRRQIGLSFDDGYRDFANNAWPLLDHFGFRATLFVVPGMAGGEASWESGDGSELLDWSQIEALNRYGVEIGAHGFSHDSLVKMSPEEALGEMRASRHLLAERLQRAPAGMAYPYGDHNHEVIQLAARAGFEWAATSRSGRNRGVDRFRVRRTTLGRESSGGTGFIRFWVKVVTGYASWVDLRMDLRRV